MSVRLDLMIRQAAQRLMVDEAALRQDLQKHLERPSRGRHQSSAPAAPVHLPDPPRPEREFFGLLLHSPRLIGPSAAQLEPSAFSDERCQRLAQLLFTRYGDGAALDLSQLISRVGEDESMVQLISLCAMVGFDEAQVDEQWQDYIYSFRKDSMTQRIEHSRIALRSALEAAQDEEVSRINAEMATLIRERQSLETEHRH